MKLEVQSWISSIAVALTHGAIEVTSDGGGLGPIRRLFSMSLTVTGEGVGDGLTFGAAVGEGIGTSDAGREAAVITIPSNTMPLGIYLELRYLIRNVMSS